MKKMSQLELENFYEKDKREYFLEDNQEFLHWYQGLERQGFVSSLSILQMQKLIDFISFYFEFKYPNTMLAEEDTIFANSEVYRKMKMISWSLDMEQFKYRLPLDYVDFWIVLIRSVLSFQKELMNILMFKIVFY